MNNNDDRRRYFRIKDKVHMDITYIPPEDLNSAVDEWQNQSQSASLLSEVEVLNRDMQVMMTEIQHQHPVIYKIFEIQGKKIDIISRAIALKGQDEEPEIHTVDISAVGLKFERPQIFGHGNMLEITLVLRPSFISFTVIARVLKSQVTDSGSFSTAVDFLHIRPQDQEALIKHVVNKQYINLQGQRQARHLDD